MRHFLIQKFCAVFKREMDAFRFFSKHSEDGFCPFLIHIEGRIEDKDIVHMLDAQSKISRELALRFDQLESTLARSLNEAMRAKKPYSVAEAQLPIG